MKSKNYVSLIGIVGKDADYRQMQQGVKYTRFTVATSEGGYTKQDGTAVPEVTQWHQVVCWGKMAEYAAKFIKKGVKVAIEGKIMYGEYQDAQGVKKMSCDIVANDFCLMQKPQQHAAAPTPPQPNGNGYQPSNQQSAQGGQYGGYQNGGGCQQFPPQVDAMGRPIGQQPQGVQQPQPAPNGGGAPSADDLPF